MAQLIWGPIGDRLGRRTPLFIGMVLFIIGSVGCALSVSIDQIIFWRVFRLWGLYRAHAGASDGTRSLCPDPRRADALHADHCHGHCTDYRAALGGQLIRVTSWHAIFWLLAGIGLLMLLALRWLPETLPPERRQRIAAEGVSSLRAAAAKPHFHPLYPESDLLLRRRLRLYYRFAGCLYSLFRR